jgi:Bacterial extracellular solute-binding protein
MRALTIALLLLTALSGPMPVNAQSVTWPAFGPERNLLRFDGFTDTLPDFIGPIDGSAELTIFTEGNHYPVLLPLVLQRFPQWCRDSHQCQADPAKILIVTLPQPTIVRMLTDGGISLGNAVLPIGPDKPVFADLVMGGLAPLRQLRAAGVVGPTARIFAHTRGMAMLVPKELAQVDTLDQFARQVGRLIVASPSEPGARRQYRDTSAALIGEEPAARLFDHEVASFAGRLGIQHRDVPYALINGLADGGLIFSHLAHFYAAMFPERLRAVAVPGAERFGQDIGMVRTSHARSALAASFERFFLEAARTAYPEGGFSDLGAAFAASTDL